MCTLLHKEMHLVQTQSSCHDSALLFFSRNTAQAKKKTNLSQLLDNSEI